MLFCSSCGCDIAPAARFCGQCGQPQDAPASTGSGSKTKIVFSQIVCALWLFGAIGWISFCGSLDWVVILGPSIIACVWPLVRLKRLTEWVERLEIHLRTLFERAGASSGKISRYFVTPFFRGS